jgi:16S rRNA G1207 methylase RsmC
MLQTVAVIVEVAKDPEGLTEDVATAFNKARNELLVAYDKATELATSPDLKSALEKALDADSVIYYDIAGATQERMQASIAAVGAQQVMNHYFNPGDGEWTSREIQVVLHSREFTLETAASTFSPEHLDTGTRILLETVPDPIGTVLDIGCGWGPLALTAALRSPESSVWGIDVNQRALELTRRNAVRVGVSNVTVGLPDEVPADLRFDTIWSNPPIRVGKAELHAILETWIPRLNPGGEAWLVVAKSLGAESLQKWLGERWPDAEVATAEIAKGFRVIAFRVPAV